MRIFRKPGDYEAVERVLAEGLDRCDVDNVAMLEVPCTVWLASRSGTLW